MKWQIISEWADPNTRTSTAAMQLPHGCMVRETVETRSRFHRAFRPVSVALTFVPAAHIEPTAAGGNKIGHRL